ncbi:pentapeptide repeat-containing protein [Nocardia nova]|uniref:pentapeptide repeat-containing protein n=1 Tax=Nocardia nova TaxID=37330 RepID=UPI0018936066|nr:pentapeptide repeat-containing protein [Nocardia nova]MBF6150274.1 pentapeptide repeat-containing protein [Nocardia nova]
MRLSTAVGLAVLTGVVIAAVAEWILFAAFHPQRGGTSVDVTKLALTVVGGVGGVVALVIAYRRQRDVEQGRFVERFGAAAAQLGATDVAVRLAGVYAMAGVADESDGLRRQQCIDVLCGYLRLPYDAAHGSSGRTKRVVTVPNPRVEDLDDPGKVEEHHEYRNNDREVRATIVRVIAAHLRLEAEYSWSTNDFDFRTAYLEDVNFRRVLFYGTTSFDRATFSGTTSFDEAIFFDLTSFDEATFSDSTSFDDATFSTLTTFDGANFSGTTSFSHVTFSAASSATFYGANFSGNTSFYGANFSDTTRLVAATFSGTTSFYGANFSDITSFDRTNFSGTTSFDRTNFSGTTSFDDATFSDTTRFDRATFSGATSFDHTTFSGICTFENVDFGARPISFIDPKGWGPPEPVFDWYADITVKPTNVEPQDWPPTVAASFSNSQ